MDLMTALKKATPWSDGGKRVESFDPWTKKLTCLTLTRESIFKVWKYYFKANYTGPTGITLTELKDDRWEPVLEGTGRPLGAGVPYFVEEGHTGHERVSIRVNESH